MSSEADSDALPLPLPPLRTPPPFAVPRPSGSGSVPPLPLKGEDHGATCEVCGLYLRRNTDLPRHMLTHAKDRASLMFRCPVDGCGHSTLQKSNLATHIRTHTRAKPHKCPETSVSGELCDFSTADPSSLHRHRKRKHGYVPRSNKSTGTAATSLPRAQTSLRIDREEEAPDVNMEEGSSRSKADEMEEDQVASASDLESEESFGTGGFARARVAPAHTSNAKGVEDEDDIDAEGELDDEESNNNVSTAMDLDRVGPVLANISSTRTTVDGPGEEAS
ncbi:hypothetical protein C8F01DRAFT_1137454 [Mycena amicta]|nr:hypothetical protein C8F01DRAFT_1137454 [Mycena amicta]